MIVGIGGNIGIKVAEDLPDRIRLLGLAAGRLSWRDGLVAAMGVHFWADMIWHVVWPLLGLGVG